MNSWVGTPKIEVTEKPKTGDRDDFTIRVIGPGNTDYQVDLSISGTATAIWGTVPTQSAQTLAETLFAVSGTAQEPPKEGFWFDSYNSADTVSETLNLIRNSGTRPFVRLQYNPSVGKSVLELLNELNKLFLEKYGTLLMYSIDRVGEESQIISDINTPPKDFKAFIFNICLLSSIIDQIHIDPVDKTGNLQSFRRWLVTKYSNIDTNLVMQPLQMVKNLRKQYPIHDHYEFKSDVRVERKEISEASVFFGIQGSTDYASNWQKVISKFTETMEKIKGIVKD